MLKEILEQMNKYLSQNLSGYRKGFSTQTALTVPLEKWKRSWVIMGMLVLHLWISKAFDTITHELLIAKLHVYGFSKKSWALIAS